MEELNAASLAGERLLEEQSTAAGSTHWGRSETSAPSVTSSELGPAAPQPEASNRKELRAKYQEQTFYPGFKRKNVSA